MKGLPPLFISTNVRVEKGGGNLEGKDITLDSCLSL
jgi:hypothetical protein